jgi:hypothetical protein
VMSSQRTQKALTARFSSACAASATSQHSECKSFRGYSALAWHRVLPMCVVAGVSAARACATRCVARCRVPERSSERDAAPLAGRACLPRGTRAMAAPDSCTIVASKSAKIR